MFLNVWFFLNPQTKQPPKPYKMVIPILQWRRLILEVNKLLTVPLVELRYKPRSLTLSPVFFPCTRLFEQASVILKRYWLLILLDSVVIVHCFSLPCWPCWLITAAGPGFSLSWTPEVSHIETWNLALLCSHGLWEKRNHQRCC